MVDIGIELLESDCLPAARKLVRRVFPWQSPIERLSFFAFAHQRSPLMRWIMRLAAITEILNFWVAIDSPSGKVLGTTGLYTYMRDATDAVWLAWFCVAPEARGKGIGSRLLDFSIAEARKPGDIICGCIHQTIGVRRMHNDYTKVAGCVLSGKKDACSTP
jgi:GNAT superfamily N-acetyltransferase